MGIDVAKRLIGFAEISFIRTWTKRGALSRLIVKERLEFGLCKKCRRACKAVSAFSVCPGSPLFRESRKCLAHLPLCPRSINANCET